MKNSKLLILVITLVVVAITRLFSAEVFAQTLAHTDRQRIENYGAIFCRALNSGTTDSYSKAVREIFAASTLESVGEARLLGQMDQIRKRFGELEYHHSELTIFNFGDRVSYVMHTYAQAKGQRGWQDFQFRLEEKPPHKIKELAFIAEVAEPISLPNGALNDPNTLRWLNDYVDKLAADNDLAGSMLIAQGEQVIYERAFGLADEKRLNKVTPDTRFNMASGSKMFTAVGIAQLVEKGKLSYSDPIIKYFPDFPNTAFAKKATVHHLLSHTSGVNEYWTAEYQKNWKQITDVKQMLPWVYKVGTAFEPGARFQYSNSNYILAGLIIERASGMDYYTYVRNYITEPLGMTATGFYLRDGSTANLAEFLKKGSDGWVLADAGARGTSAGGCYSTPRDMLKFSRGLIAGKLTSQQTLALLTTSKTTGLNSDTNYGYGFELSNEGQVSSFGHGGITSGVNFAFRYFPGEDLTFVIFNNQDNGAYDDLRKNVVKLVTGAR